uniref:Clp ATPase C-terminal domain-containing protein n=1 Tax=Calcidiscus leptoporus TaxID=127549 RepID=A0A7S0NQW9_9EUKA|mmetsp:Transcript_14966/g.34277  ORF Transcript_14966/g.34277 Transcript_14966/m.34277 type:complete len:113 (+) Transcript_14966:1-339(+)
MGALRERLAARSVTLVATPAALEVLADLGYNPEFGARPLKRVIQKELEAPLAKALLAGDICDGDDAIVEVDLTSTRIVVRRMHADEHRKALGGDGVDGGGDAGEVVDTTAVV